jgi:hypothetical protein
MLSVCSGRFTKPNSHRAHRDIKPKFYLTLFSTRSVQRSFIQKSCAGTFDLLNSQSNALFKLSLGKCASTYPVRLKLPFFSPLFSFSFQLSCEGFRLSDQQIISGYFLLPGSVFLRILSHSEDEQRSDGLMTIFRANLMQPRDSVASRNSAVKHCHYNIPTPVLCQPILRLNLPQRVNTDIHTRCISMIWSKSQKARPTETELFDAHI